MALFVASRRLGVTQHPALWSPDFPLAVETLASDCLASFGCDFIASRDRRLDFRNPAALHGAELGFVIGSGGFLIGIYIYLTPPEGVTLQLVTG